jgi:hypothetical protein
MGMRMSMRWLRSGILRCACVLLASARARLYRVWVMIGNNDEIL